MKDNRDKKRKNSSKKVVTSLNNDELFDEIMRRKRERKQKRELKNNTIKIDKITDIEKNEVINNIDKKIENEDVKEISNNIDLKKSKDILEDTKVILNLEYEHKKIDEKLDSKDNDDIDNCNQQIVDLEVNSKVLPPSYISDITETIDISEIIKLQNKSRFKVIFLIPILFIIVIVCVVIFLIISKEEEVEVNEISLLDINVNSYNYETDEVYLSVLPSKKQKSCIFLKNKVDNFDDMEFIDVNSGACEKLVDREVYYVYFKNESGIVSNALEVNNYVVSVELEDNYYITPGTPVDLGMKLVTVGDVDLKWYGNGEELNIDNNVYYTDTVDKVLVEAKVDGESIANTNIISTNVITNIPSEFNTGKSHLTCRQFTQEEAQLLDKILEDRIEKAGIGTRAGVVAAARFLTLEFPYRISYFYETGRLNNTGAHYVDGEGRYYHKGLYLDESKYEGLVANFFGPAMWGCNMVTYEDDAPYFAPGRKYPNGLDCSGFVSWSLLNGGFDVGDYGAGPLAGKDLTDSGELKKLTSTLINSGSIKVGDLFSMSGHIGILVGQDSSNYYVAESLQTYGGLVIKKYSKLNVMNVFPNVVLMDGLYNSDGNLTDMWY